ncbi:unnamed protein product [Nippostrongylus brasiliensis]|uniref:Uncharacterized protein n=1 Tax=Nippostrongylus brasiliensis TaxID=27835 RepID=A0A0N4YQL2_NIPBR|nr:unnamed protein product [Nippostrongylus brasiliensis]
MHRLHVMQRWVFAQKQREQLQPLAVRQQQQRQRRRQQQQQQQARYGCGLENQAKTHAQTCSGVGSNLLGTTENFYNVPTSQATSEMQALQIVRLDSCQ